LDGVNLLPRMLGESRNPPHQRLFWRTGGGLSFAVREGRYKLFKSVKSQPQLYDLDSDIGETKDLAATRPDLLNRLNSACEEWNRELIPPIFQSPRPQERI
jgi:hypothetical protein